MLCQASHRAFCNSCVSNNHIHFESQEISVCVRRYVKTDPCPRLTCWFNTVSCGTELWSYGLLTSVKSQCGLNLLLKSYFKFHERMLNNTKRSLRCIFIDTQVNNSHISHKTCHKYHTFKNFFKTWVVIYQIKRRNIHIQNTLSFTQYL